MAQLPLGPDSVTWRVNREPALLLGGGRALLLQVTHPLVGAGVEQHSNYQADPWSRLFSTLDTMFRITFGTPEQSAHAATRLQRRHVAVQGTASEGTPYRALDPDLLVWVWATLTDTSLVIYERCFGPLPAARREQFVEEGKLIAYACGVPEGGCPAHYGDFRAYVDEMSRTALCATPTAVEVARQLRHPLLPAVLRGLAAKPLTLVTAGLLPAHLRTDLGFAWTPRHDRALDRFFAAAKAQRAIPRRVRELPVNLAARRETPLRPPKWLV
ncbi:MAG: hypothetical protein QOD45_907, partial [Pseudonocardiales bacterium]|nr:hypothetical protein [Pseudonocardiales bacterium]